jgi:hypothetical protein
VASIYANAGGCNNVNWRLSQLIGGPTNGITAFRFTLEGQTIGRNFVLIPARGSNIDLDVTFILEGEDHVQPEVVSEHATRSPDGEWGKVPKGANMAYVCLNLGMGGAFTYKAGFGVKPPAPAHKH